MSDKLKKGQAFIGIDGNKYYFLGLDYDGQFFFTTIDAWSNKQQEYYIKNNIFIDKILDEKSSVIEDCAWFYQSKQELEDSTLDEKLKRCLDIIKQSSTSEMEIHSTRIGSYVKGQAYSKQFDQYYEVIGFIIETHIYINNKINRREKGFFSIYHSNCDDGATLLFELNDKNELGFDSNSFISSNGDKVDILEELLSKDEVNESCTISLTDYLEKTFYDDREK